MDRLWAPWRLSYVAAPKSADVDPGCFLCTALSESNDRENLVVTRSEWGAVVLNKFPYSNGHVLVVPRAHKASPGSLTDEETLDLQRLLTRAMSAFDRAMKPEGYNVGLNLGRAGGAGLPGHLHWHVVPRWMGDMNFMPVVADTRVLVQSLDALYDVLAAELR
jgi:ATP adenylyltransferase